APARTRRYPLSLHDALPIFNGLVGTCELLATTRLEEEQREYVSAIQASSRSLLALVEDVLDISAIEAGKLRLHQEEFSIAETIRSEEHTSELQSRENLVCRL